MTVLDESTPTAPDEPAYVQERQDPRSRATRLLVALALTAATAGGLLVWLAPGASAAGGCGGG